MTELLVFKGREIKQKTLKKLWEEIRQELELYKDPVWVTLVESIKMPEIVAATLTPRRYTKTRKRLQASPHITDTSVIEWGESVEVSSACTLWSDTGVGTCGGGIILVCEGRGQLEDNLRHELLHVWERALGLTWGSLTRLKEEVSQ